MQFIQKIKQTIKERRLIQFGDSVLIAVSGGADSLVLLFSLYALKEMLGLRLTIAHLDHGLRSGSDKDLLFVASIAKKLQIPFFSKSIKFKKGKSGSIEEKSREARLDFLIATARKIKADKIALGHTKDDQAETVLMRIIRGSGLYGLSAIFPKRNIKGLIFIRPLIDSERRETQAFIKKLRIKPREDKTNLQTKFLRNKIRLKLLPLLEEEFNPRIKQALSQLAEIALTDYELLESLAKNSLEDCARIAPAQKSIVLDLRKFLKLNASLKRMVIRLAIERLTRSLRKFSFKHWQEIEDLILAQNTASCLDLPRHISISKQKDKIVLTVRNP